MKLVEYDRTSTDDKDQNPDRQHDVIRAWAAANKHDLVARVVDEGTSGAKDPFQRQQFLEAIQAAKEYGAEGIVIEHVDRGSRGGVEAYMHLKATLRIDHDLVLKTATTPIGLPPAIEEYYDATMAMVARLFRDRLREQIKSGIARAKADGFPNGRPGKPPKPELTLAEKDLISDLVLNQGAGIDKCALEVSRARGAFDVGDPGAMMERRVGPTWLWKNVRRSQMVEVCERWKARQVVRPASGLKENGGGA